jgi:hypothetical protein
MPRPRNDIPLAYLAESFDLDPTTPSGLRWRFRAHMTPHWNAAFAGKPAGTAWGQGYLQICLTFDGRERKLKAHRVVFALSHGHWPEQEIDHKNGVEAGNDIDNLRSATNGQNAHNQKIYCTNTSGFPGVSWDKQKRRWLAGIMAGGRTIRFGRFNSREQAGAAYLAAKAILHPYAPLPRGMTPLYINPRVRLHAVKTIVKTARKHHDTAMQSAAWQYAFLTAC